MTSISKILSTFTVSMAAALALIAPAAALAQTPGASVAGSESITSFISDVTVNADGSASVRETIEYHFTGPKHGLIRNLPLRYKDETGRRLEMPISLRSVTDGSSIVMPYVTEKSGDWLDVRIGDADKTVSGTVTYVISYDIRGALRHFEDHDELYWNATGTSWEVPIERSGATVHLPESVPAESLKMRCYTGPDGSTAQDCLAAQQGRTATFAASGPLTVVVGWKPGSVAIIPPTFIPDPLYVQYPFITAAVVLLFTALGAVRLGRPGAGGAARETARTSSGSGFDSDSGSSGGGAGGGGGKSW